MNITHTHHSTHIDGACLDQVIADLNAGLINNEQAADAILHAEGALCRAGGAYSAARLSRKMRLEQSRLPTTDEEAIPEEVMQYLISRRADELVRLANLRPMEEICLRLRIGGLDVRDSARTLGIGRRRVELHLRTARRKVRAIYNEGPYAGWYQVYLSEIRRGRKPYPCSRSTAV